MLYNFFSSMFNTYTDAVAVPYSLIKLLFLLFGPIIFEIVNEYKVSIFFRSSFSLPPRSPKQCYCEVLNAHFQLIFIFEGS